MASLNDIETRILNIVDILDYRAVTTITGALPITFRSNGTALINYRIFGTVDGAGVQTENGYKLPLTITSGVERKDTDIYIGDSKLGAEEYVDYEEQKVYKRTENLFDTNNAAFVYGYFGAGSPISDYNPNTRISYIICEPSTTYTVCKTLSTRFSVSWSESEPTNGVAIYGNIYENDATNITITTGATAKYLVFYYFHASYDTLTEQEIRDSIMIVKGSTPPKTYIPYLQPTDPPLTLPELETFEGTNTLDSTETLGDVTIKGKIKEVI